MRVSPAAILIAAAATAAAAAVTAAPACRHPDATGPEALSGAWEGEISDPRRPIVVTVDFTARAATLAAGGPMTGPIHLLPSRPSPPGQVLFDVQLGDQTLRFAGTR
ncbi:MAG TPA: hypothetical protein VKB80_14500, partial [Kofleriaceae bacterium]|nr:hypothetical protein [Kofleriaceae bacterium]